MIRAIVEGAAALSACIAAGVKLAWWVRKTFGR